MVAGVAGQALSVVVAGQTVVGTGVAGRPGLPVKGQLLEALRNAGVVLAQVGQVVAGSAKSGRQAGSAGTHAGGRHSCSRVVVAVKRNASGGVRVEGAEVASFVAGGADRPVAAGGAVVRAPGAGTGGAVSVGA